MTRTLWVRPLSVCPVSVTRASGRDRRIWARASHFGHRGGGQPGTRPREHDRVHGRQRARRGRRRRRVSRSAAPWPWPWTASGVAVGAGDGLGAPASPNPARGTPSRVARARSKVASSAPLSVTSRPHDLDVGADRRRREPIRGFALDRRTNTPRRPTRFRERARRLGQSWRTEQCSSLQFRTCPIPPPGRYAINSRTATVPHGWASNPQASRDTKVRDRRDAGNMDAEQQCFSHHHGTTSRSGGLLYHVW
jgi:hypothetical protein